MGNGFEPCLAVTKPSDHALMKSPGSEAGRGTALAGQHRHESGK